MSFADRYLQKHVIRGPFINDKADQNLKYFIAIPAYNESGLIKCLDSLFLCESPGAQTEVLVLINQGENTAKDIKENNRISYQEVQGWIESHQREDIHFHVALADSLPKKHFGAGLARKLVMDEAIRRFGSVCNPEGIIFSLDADTLVEKNYIKAVAEHFSQYPGASGCSIQFSHPLEGNEFSPEVYKSIRSYEAHLHYYLKALRYTGTPYAFHTIGSCFAVKAKVYCEQGGMSKRQAGEDFYFIQKVALQGNYTECNSTTVYPSPRPSDRVPFGTGPEIIRQMNNPDLPYLTFTPELFQHLKKFFDQAPGLYKNRNTDDFLAGLHPILVSFLKENAFRQQVEEIRKNVASNDNFTQRFMRKFNMFWILKYLHFAEAKGIPKMEVNEAQRVLSNIIETG